MAYKFTPPDKPLTATSISFCYVDIPIPSFVKVNTGDLIEVEDYPCGRFFILNKKRLAKWDVMAGEWKQLYIATEKG